MPFTVPKFEKRDDGQCNVCVRSKAETRDGLFCVPCLHEQIRRDTPIASESADDDEGYWEAPDLISVLNSF